MTRHSVPEGCETRPPPLGRGLEQLWGGSKAQEFLHGCSNLRAASAFPSTPSQDTQAGWRHSIPSCPTFSCVFTALCRSLIYQLGSSYAWDVLRILDVHTCWRIPQPVFVAGHEMPEQMLILILSSRANRKLCRNRLVYILPPQPGTVSQASLSQHKRVGSKTGKALLPARSSKIAQHSQLKAGMLVKSLLSNRLDFEQALQRQIPFPLARVSCGGTPWISAIATSLAVVSQHHRLEVHVLISGQQGCFQ